MGMAIRGRWVGPLEIGGLKREASGCHLGTNDLNIKVCAHSTYATISRGYKKLEPTLHFVNIADSPSLFKLASLHTMQPNQLHGM